MTLPLALLLASPVLFPGHHPVAVWIGLGCAALGLLVMWRADEMGGCETTLRALEARDWLNVMQDRRVA